MTEPLRIFIGYDSREPLAYAVLAHSIMRRASGPVSIAPVMLSQLKKVYTRERGPTESTEFSLTRFLVPYLCGYEGRAIFMDCDMLCLDDIYRLDYEAGPSGKAVWVVQHDYTPKTDLKMDGCVQTKYPRKNWSSLMVFDNAKCKALTPEYVNAATGLELHRFHWLMNGQIGKLDPKWNHLVGEYEPSDTAKILHYTLGGPWFPMHRSCDNAQDWVDELNHMLAEQGVEA